MTVELDRLSQVKSSGSPGASSWTIIPTRVESINHDPWSFIKKVPPFGSVWKDFHDCMFSMFSMLRYLFLCFLRVLWSHGFLIFHCLLCFYGSHVSMFSMFPRVSMCCMFLCLYVFYVFYVPGFLCFLWFRWFYVSYGFYRRDVKQSWGILPIPPCHHSAPLLPHPDRPTTPKHPKGNPPLIVTHCSNLGFCESKAKEVCYPLRVLFINVPCNSSSADGIIYANDVNHDLLHRSLWLSRANRLRPGFDDH